MIVFLPGSERLALDSQSYQEPSPAQYHSRRRHWALLVDGDCLLTIKRSLFYGNEGSLSQSYKSLAFLVTKASKSQESLRCDCNGHNHSNLLCSWYLFRCRCDFNSIDFWMLLTIDFLRLAHSLLGHILHFSTISPLSA